MFKGLYFTTQLHYLPTFHKHSCAHQPPTLPLLSETNFQPRHRQKSAQDQETIAQNKKVPGGNIVIIHSYLSMIQFWVPEIISLRKISKLGNGWLEGLHEHILLCCGRQLDICVLAKQNKWSISYGGGDFTWFNLNGWGRSRGFKVNLRVSNWHSDSETIYKRSLHTQARNPVMRTGFQSSLGTGERQLKFKSLRDRRC
jgi:hypothetical protein